MKKILLIDDTEPVLQNLKDLLQMEGYEIVTATNGHEGFDKLYLYNPDLIITDLRMPKMDGFVFLQKIKEQPNYKAIPILVFSANATPENEQKCLALGAIRFLNKPCSADLLIEVVQGILPPL